MSFDEFRNPPRWSLDCRRWADGPSTRRHGSLAVARRAQINAEERQRRIRAFAREHHVSEREAEDELFDVDDDVAR